MTSEKRLMTCYYLDLGIASDWLKQTSLAARPIKRTTLIWLVKRHQYGISALVLQTSLRGEDSGGLANCSSVKHEVLWEKCTLFEFQYISHFSTNWGHYIYVSYWRRDRHFTWSSKLHEGLFFSERRLYLHFSVTLRPWVLIQSRKYNPRPPALQSSALMTELIPPRLKL